MLFKNDTFSSEENGRKRKKQSIPILIKDDDRWHEKQMSFRNVLKQKIDEYSNNFTMHALSKIITGKNIESWFWFIMLCCGLITCFVVIHGLVSKYLRYDVYTEIRSVIADENYFPAITFCEHSLFVSNFFTYCNIPPSQYRSTDHKATCKKRLSINEPNITFKDDVFWSNGLFNVTRCKTLGGKSCLNNQFLKTMHHYNHSCFTWNYGGNMTDVYSHVVLNLDFNQPVWFLGDDEEILALPHHRDVHEIDITKKVEIEPRKTVEIKLEKTIIKRLPAPFPSKCSDEKGEDIFPGHYTRKSCIESHKFIEIYKECGDIYDYVHQFVPEELQKTYKKNLTFGEAIKCFKEKGRLTETTAECSFPCVDYDLSVMHSSTERQSSNFPAKYQVIIQFQKVDTYQTIEEKELYSWDQMLSEMGGLIGLVIGASVISVVEILVCLFLIFLKKFCC